MRPTAARTESPTLEPVVGEIDGYLAAWLRRRGLPDTLERAVCYSALDGGKRLRPALVLLACDAVGGRREDALPAACAIELIHTFSLVHDDLPAMDDDDLRRGRPTLHVEAGEAAAVLAGDVMMSLAFELLGTAPIEPPAITALVRELAAATSAMIVGQVYDTIGGFPPGIGREERLELIHRNKTGALLRAASRMGAICGGADEATLAAMSDYGEALGLMFQIVDDLLDVTQSAEHIGKATGKDEVAGKLTYPSVHGSERSLEEVRRQRERARAAIATLGVRAEPLRELCDDMAVRTK